MLVSAKTLLLAAQADRFALGAFNVYNLEGVQAVIRGAEEQKSPVMLQVHPGALKLGGPALLELCLAAARRARVPVAVHLDHSDDPAQIKMALKIGLTSVMADGSGQEYERNVAFTKTVGEEAHARGAVIEGELGRLAGYEDGMAVSLREARLTDPHQAIDFVMRTGVDALAVCIGNVHGDYAGEPDLDFERLRELQQKISVPLVLHGASGLPDTMIRQAIELGVCKFNVNTEVRKAYVQALTMLTGRVNKIPDLPSLMEQAINAMTKVVSAKLILFGASGRA